MISDYFTLAFRNLRKRRLRSWLTIIGIVISIATIFMLVSVSLGLQSAVEEQFRQLGTDKFFVIPKGQIAGPGTDSAAQLTVIDSDEVEKVQGVKGVSYFVASNVKIEFNNQIRYVIVIGVPLDKGDIFIENGAFKPEEGRFLEIGDSKDIAIGSQYKYNNFFNRPLRLNDKITINGVDFKVRSILETRGNPSDDRLILMPLEEFRALTGTVDNIDEIIVQVNDESEIKEVAERVEKKLRRFRDVTEKTQDFTILTPEELLESFGNILNIITAFLAGVATISLIVGGIGIANTMYTSVIERTREIGTMKAVGAKNKDILLIFLIEAGFLGLLGGIIGVLIGMAVSKTIEFIAFNNLGTSLLQAVFPSYLIIGCLLFAFLSGAISGIWPAYNASKLKAVDALRYE